MKKGENHLHLVAYTLLGAIALVSLWRGAWGLMDTYLFPGNYVLSFLTSLIFGLVVLSLNKHLLKHLINI